MIAKLLTVLTGFVFALGLGISQMTRPPKILAFLDLLGDWDPSLLLVMLAAVTTYYLSQKMILSYFQPKFSSSFILPKEQDANAKTLVGAAIFGIGWGLLGLCPGPSIAVIASGAPAVPVFVVSMIAGIYLSTVVKTS